MIEKILNRLMVRRKGKCFSAWQIELTTRCPLKCKMCIRRESEGWKDQDMSLEEFKKVLPYLKGVEVVVLEGWGESLLHPNLSECIRLVKREGSQVGFVTSGKGLTQRRIAEFIDAGIDFVGFSIAGTTAKTHDAIRVNSHLSEIQDAIQSFTEEKFRQGTARPRMHLVFLMLKENISEVPLVPVLAKEMGIEEVVFTNICHCINNWQEEQRVFLWEEGQNEYEKIVKQAEAKGRELKIRVKRPSLSAFDAPLCSENPLTNLYISVDGAVSPCVYLYPPLASPFKRIFHGKEYGVEKVSFGNIFGEPFPEIWRRRSYNQFRNCFIQREEKFKEAYLSLLDNPKSRNLKKIELSEPPESCKNCHKILGV